MAETNEKQAGRWEHLKIAGGYTLLVVMVAALLGELSMLFGLTHPEATTFLTAKDAAFYLLASVTLVSGVLVAFSRSIIYSAVALLGALLGAGGLYVLLHADFVAITQLLIYVGGVLVLILFAVMLTARIGDRSATNPSTAMVPALALLAALVVGLGFAAVRAPWASGRGELGPESTAEGIGNLFLGKYLLPFEVISLLLLATLIGAVVVARKEIKE